MVKFGLAPCSSPSIWLPVIHGNSKDPHIQMRKKTETHSRKGMSSPGLVALVVHKFEILLLDSH